MCCDGNAKTPPPPIAKVLGAASVVNVATADLPSRTRNGGGNESELETPEGSRDDADGCWPPKLLLYNRFKHSSHGRIAGKIPVDVRSNYRPIREI